MGKPKWGTLIKGFGPRLVGMGGFAVVATSLELWDILDDYDKSDVALDKKILSTKAYSAGAFLFIAVPQTFAGIAALGGYGIFTGWIMHPAVLGVTVLIGSIYLLSTLAFNYFKRDIVGHWLHKCRWSRYPEERFKDEIEENQTFLEIQLAPALFVKPTFELKHHYSPSAGSIARESQNGAWLQLLLPASVRGELAHVNLIASGRPFPGFPVEKVGDSLKNPFSGYGTVEAVTEWREASSSKTQVHWNEPPQKPKPPADEDVIWQTWVPLNESAQYLELQVWYSPETLAIRDGDKGYRFQIELVPEGQTDNSDSRVVGLNESPMIVESLGGRKDAVLLPIPL